MIWLSGVRLSGMFAFAWLLLGGVSPGTKLMTPPPVPASPTLPGGSSPAPPVELRPDGKSNRIYQSSQNLTYNDKTRIYHMWGNVRVQRKETVLTADDATFNEVTGEGLVTGNPKLAQPGTTVTGDRMRVFQKERKAVVEGNAHLIYDRSKIPPKPGSAPRPPAAGKKKNPEDDEPVHLYAPHVELYWEKNQGEATGGVRVVQGNRSITADLATFDHAANLITFTGNVVVRRGKDDSLTSHKLTLHTITHEAIAEGNVETVVMVEESEHKTSKPVETKEQPKTARERREEARRQREKESPAPPKEPAPAPSADPAPERS